jgi:hypothetical protein
VRNHRSGIKTRVAWAVVILFVLAAVILPVGVLLYLAGGWELLVAIGAALGGTAALAWAVQTITEGGKR